MSPGAFKSMRQRLTTGVIGNIMGLITASTMAQLIAILLQLALRRLYLPSIFGAFAVCLSLIEIIVAIGTLRYETAIVLPREDKEAANLFGLSFFISLFVNLLVLILFLFFRQYFISFLNFPEKYLDWFMLIPLISLIFSLYQIINNWLIRQKAFRAISINKMSRRGVEGIVQFFLGLAAVPAGMIIGTLFGHIANVLSGLRQMRRSLWLKKSVTARGMGKAMRRYRDFSRYGAFPALLNTFSTLMPVFIINKFYNESVTGYFDLSRQVLLIPIALIANSIAQVYMERLVAIKNSGGSIMKEFRRTSNILLIFSAVTVLILVAGGPAIFGFVFGQNGLMSGQFARILVLALPLKLIAMSFLPVFTVFEKIKTGGIWQAFYFLSILSLVFFRNFSIGWFMGCYVIIESACYIVCLLLIYRIIHQYETSLASPD